MFWLFLDWSFYSQQYPKIKFSEFLHLYNINKRKWDLNHKRVEYREKAMVDHWGDVIYKSHFVSFGFFDYLIYRCWLEYEKCNRKKDEAKSKLEKFYNAVYEEHDDEY